MGYDYAWHGIARTPSRSQSSKSQHSTPSRSSRRTGFTNLTHYNAFTRSDGVVFRVGDAVQVWDGTDFAPSQIWLDPYKTYHDESDQSRARNAGRPAAASGSKTPTKAKNKGKAKMAQREEENEDWIVNDGLEDPVKFGIVIDLFEDEQGNMKAKIHWLARPRLLCYLFGQRAGTEEGLDESHPNELIYPFDPEAITTSSSAGKPSRAEDTHDVSYLLSTIKIVSEKSFSKQAENPAPEDDNAEGKAYFVRKAINTRAEQADGWFYDIEWQDIYERGCSTGIWELQTATEVVEVKQSKRDKTKPSRASGSAKAKKIIKKVVTEVEKDLPGRSQASPSKKVSRAKSEADSEMMSESESDSSSEDGDDAEAAPEDCEPSADDDSDADMDASLSSSEEEEPPSEPEPSSDDDDVFGPVTASGRKRKAGRTPSKGKSSPNKRNRTVSGRSAPLLLVKPSAATLRKAAARATRQAQRIADRQARRLKPRLPLVQQKHVGQPRLDANGKEHPLSAFEKARAVLHVGCTPDYLPCRDEEYAEIEAYLEDAIDEGVGSCIYIAGVPGTGKTATVRSVMSSLQERAAENQIKPFRFLEINGMKITDPAQSFSILWEFVSGNRVAPKAALAQLETHFKTPNPGRDTCVVLVDELDQLVTKKQEVIYNFFNWPNQPHSRLIVLAIANTMDLPERELSNKINSRLGSNRINFTPYDKSQLIEILTTRLEGLDGVFAKEAIGLVAGKVASVTGDARRALDICRRAVEKVEAENLVSLQGQKDVADGAHKVRLVNAGDIVTVHKDMTSSGLLLFVKRAGLHQRIMLLALSRAIRKVGVADEVEFGDVIRWHLDFCRQTAINPLPTHTQLFSILQSLADMKLVTTEGSRLDYFQRVQANVRDDELDLVLRKENRFVHYLR